MENPMNKWMIWRENPLFLVQHPYAHHWDDLDEGKLLALKKSIAVKAFVTSFTLPETNIAPENRPLEKEIPIGNHHF